MAAMTNSVTLLDASGATVNTFTTIQAAVNAAANGDTLVLSAGTFQEQVTVNGLTNLTIEGAGQGQTIIKSPDEASLTANLQNPDEQHSNQNAIVGIENNASVAISNLTIDGNNQGDVFALFPQGAGQQQGGDLVGLEALSSSVNASNVTITNVEDVENGILQGGQGNKAIIVDDRDGSTQSFTLTGSNINNFQKAGVLAEGAGLTVNINNNTVVGVGSAPNNLSQNLIEVDFAATGSISQNMISGVSDANGGSAGILAFESGDGLVVNGNAVAGLAGNANSVGVFFEGVNAPTVTGNTITEQGLALAFYSPFTAAINQSGNTFSGNALNFQFIADTASTIPWLVTGTNGIDDLEGGAGNDVFTVQASHANSTFVGNDGIDTVQGYAAGSTLAIQGGNWTVVDGSDTDTLSGIEKVAINGQVFDLVDQLGANTGGFQSLQAAASGAQSGDIVLANSGASPVTVSLAVNKVTIEPSQGYTGITLMLTGSAHNVTLADFAPGQGTAVTVLANAAGGTIVGNDAADHFIAGAGADTFVVQGSGTTIDQFGTGDVVDMANLAFATGATAVFGGGTLTVTSNNISQSVTLNSPSGTTFDVKSDGTGGTDIGFPAANPFDATWTLAGIGDFNGDGNSDLAWRRPGQTEIQFLNSVNPAGGGLVPNSPFDSTWNIVGTGDFNADGMADLVYFNAGLDLPEIQFMNGNNGIGGGKLSADPFDSTWNIAGVGDFNHDGHSDLVWHRASDGLTEIQFLNGLTSVGGGAILNSPFASPEWQIVGVGDFNGDGNSDLVFRDALTNVTQIQFLNGTTPVGGGAIANNAFNTPVWKVAGVGDFNGDGHTDLVFSDVAAGLTEIQFLNGIAPVGGGEIANNPFENNSSWQVAGVGDFNGDGHPDLVFHNSATGATAIEYLHGTTAIGTSTLGFV